MRGVVAAEELHEPGPAARRPGQVIEQMHPLISEDVEDAGRVEQQPEIAVGQRQRAGEREQGQEDGENRIARDEHQRELPRRADRHCVMAEDAVMLRRVPVVKGPAAMMEKVAMDVPFERVAGQEPGRRRHRLRGGNVAQHRQAASDGRDARKGRPEEVGPGAVPIGQPRQHALPKGVAAAMSPRRSTSFDRCGRAMNGQSADLQ